MHFLTDAHSYTERRVLESVNTSNTVTGSPTYKRSPLRSLFQINVWPSYLQCSVWTRGMFSDVLCFTSTINKICSEQTTHRRVDYIICSGLQFLVQLLFVIEIMPGLRINTTHEDWPICKIVTGNETDTTYCNYLVSSTQSN